MKTKAYLIAVLVAALAASSAHATVVDIPLQTADECGATLQNSTSELIISFSPCLVSSGASEECCRALEDTFAFTNEKFGGCLCHPILMNTVMQLAEGFMPGASALIPTAMDECVANYSSEFAYYGQTSGAAMCDPSVFVDVDAVDSSVLQTFMPTSMSADSEPKAVDSQDAEKDEGEVGTAADSSADVTTTEVVEEENADAGSSSNEVDTALTIFSVLTVEECGLNLVNGKDQLIGALTPCIIAEAPTLTCCRAVENVFKYENEDFGGCLCHSQVMEGIFAEAEGFLPGSTSIIQSAFDTCTDEFGSKFSFNGQRIGHESCSGEELQAPSMVQAGSVEAEGDNPFDMLKEQFSDPSNSAASTVSVFAASLLVAGVTLAWGSLL
jgi:hypothetical protein